MPLAIAEHWYGVKILSKNVTWIDEPHIHPGAVGNIWLLEGSEQCLVFDTGTGIGDLAKTIALLTNKPVTAIASTGYYDHAGGLWQFRHRAVHALESTRVSRPTPRSTVSDKYFRQTALTAVPYAGFKAEYYVMQGSEPTRLLADGTRIELGGRCFEVLHTPGVTAGSIALYEEKTGFLFSGESLSDSDPFYMGEPVDESSDADIKARWASLKRLLDLDVAMVYPGHRSPFDAGRLRQILKQHL